MRLSPILVRRFAILVATAFVVAAASGCGYNVGNAYQADVRTVYAPMFKSDAYHRGVEFELTEAVHKQIQQRTPFRIVTDPNADTKLTGKIAQVRKNVLGESRFDDPRELQLQYMVDVTWEDLRTGRILNQERIPIDPDVVHLVSNAEFAPEVGQSRATGTQQAIDRMARQIVDMMQTPW